MTSGVSYLSLWDTCSCSLHSPCSLAGSAPAPAHTERFGSSKHAKLLSNAWLASKYWESKLIPPALLMHYAKARFCSVCSLEGEAGLWFVSPLHGFQRKKQPDSCFKTFLGIMLMLLLDYCSQIAHSAELKALCDLEIWGAGERGQAKYS